MVHRVLLSPKVSELVNDEMAAYLVSQLDSIVARPAEPVELRRGSVNAWGVELTSEDGRRAYRVAFVIEDDDTGDTVLSICSMDEKTQLEAPVSRRKKLKGWRTVAVGDTMDEGLGRNDG